MLSICCFRFLFSSSFNCVNCFSRCYIRIAKPQQHQETGTNENTEQQKKHANWTQPSIVWWWQWRVVIYSSLMSFSWWLIVLPHAWPLSFVLTHLHNLSDYAFPLVPSRAIIYTVILSCKAMVLLLSTHSISSLWQEWAGKNDCYFTSFGFIQISGYRNADKTKICTIAQA